MIHSRHELQRWRPDAIGRPSPNGSEVARLSGIALDSLRMNGCDSGVPSKIPDVEGEQPSDLMDVHGRHQARIMYLYTGNGMADNQIPPLIMHGLAVFEKRKLIFYKSCPAVHLGNRKTKPVAIGRTRAGIPELSQILRRVAQVVSSHPEPVYSGPHQRVVAVIRFDEP